MHARWCFVAVFSLTLMGCSSMGLEQRASATPTFDFIEFFSGHQRVSGWFADRFGNVRRHFCGDFVGTVRDDGVLVLDEALYYSDGMVETRVWEVSIDEQGNFRAVSDSLVGDAVGKVQGNAMNIKYVMNVQIDESSNWALSMNDFMFLQPDGSLHNITQVKKFGIRIGSVSAQYFRPTVAPTAEEVNGSCLTDPMAAPDVTQTAETSAATNAVPAAKVASL